MVRILVEKDHGRPDRHDRILPLFKHQSELEELGISLVTDNPDCVIACQDVAGQYLDRGVPVIIFEASDQCRIAEGTRVLLDHPRLMAVLSMAVCRPLELNNEPLIVSTRRQEIVRQGVHCLKIYRENPQAFPSLRLKEPALLPPTALQKIKAGWPLFFHKQIDDCALPVVDLDRERPFDLLFFGNVGYADAATTWHRVRCFLAASTLNPRIKSVIRLYGRSTDQARHLAGITLTQPVEKAQYFELLEKTKIVVSPWGTGECCFRDYEAMLRGCVVIKPDSAYCETALGDYQNFKTYIPCKVDFSDLSERVEEVLDQWAALKELRYHNQRRLFDARQNFKAHLKVLLKCIE